MNKFLAVFAAFAMAIAGAISAPTAKADFSRGVGRFVASQYSSWGATVVSGNTATGSQTITVQMFGVLPDGRAFPPPYTGENVTVDLGSAQETVQLTGVSSATCPTGVSAVTPCYNVTASFSNTHGNSIGVRNFSSSTGGFEEAHYDAFLSGGGIVVIDNAWSGTNANITSTVVFGNVAVEDDRSYAPQYWVGVGGPTALAAPATLTSSTVADALAGTGAGTTGGFYTNAAAYHVCIAYVDIMGQEGPCSADYSFTPAAGSTNQIGFKAPAASTGAVGYTIYISLTSGTYTLSYKVPLATYSAGLPTSNGVCAALTKLETTTAACAVSNTLFGQSGSTAVVSALTLNTSPIAPQATVVSTTSVYVPNPGGRTTYAYTPSAHVGIPGLPVAFTPFTISAADATTVPSVLGTINLPSNFMNFAGRGIEVCGYATTSASTGTIQDIQLQWDAIGQNTAGKGVQVADLTVTKTATSVLQLTFCAPLQTTVAGSGATAGSMQQAGGFITSSIASLSAAAAGGPTQAGATASLNLANESRLNIVYVHTTGTDGTALTLQSVYIRPL